MSLTCNEWELAALGLIKQCVWVHQWKKLLEKSREDIAAMHAYCTSSYTQSAAAHESGDAQAFPIHQGEYVILLLIL